MFKYLTPMAIILALSCSPAKATEQSDVPTLEADPPTTLTTGPESPAEETKALEINDKPTWTAKAKNAWKSAWSAALGDKQKEEEEVGKMSETVEVDKEMYESLIKQYNATQNELARHYDRLGEFCSPSE